jgi:hypothetical protein
MLGLLLNSLLVYPALAAGLSKDIQASSRSAPGGPILFGVVRNETTERRTINVGLTVDGSCAEHMFMNRWDEQHQWPTDVLLEPMAWFALVIPSGLTNRVSTDECNAVIETMELTENRQRLHPRTQKKFALKQDAPQLLRIQRKGDISVDASVVAEVRELLDGNVSVPGSPMEIQIRIVNRSSEWRLLELADRQVTCVGKSIGTWRLGGGEAMSGASAGPLDLRPGGWLIFSQRLLLQGNPADCRVKFGIEELQDIWRIVASVQVKLTPTVQRLRK